MIDDFDRGYYAGEKQAAEDIEAGISFDGWRHTGDSGSSFTLGWYEGYEDTRVFSETIRRNREDYERELRQRETE